MQKGEHAMTKREFCLAWMERSSAPMEYQLQAGTERIENGTENTNSENTEIPFATRNGDHILRRVEDPAEEKEQHAG